MTPEQKHIIRQTFALVQPIAPQAAALFYARLFAIAPTTQSLFPYTLDTPEMAQQGVKLMQTLAVAVAHLDRLEAVMPTVEALARRHVGYGVLPEHYAAVGSALLWTLAQGLGEAFSPAAALAWEELYATLAGVMQRAASPISL